MLEIIIILCQTADGRVLAPLRLISQILDLKIGVVTSRILTVTLSRTRLLLPLFLVVYCVAPPSLPSAHLALNYTAALHIHAPSSLVSFYPQKLLRATTMEAKEGMKTLKNCSGSVVCSLFKSSNCAPLFCPLAYISIQCLSNPPHPPLTHTHTNCHPALGFHIAQI